MSAKDLIIDFLNFIFLIAIISFFIVFFIVGDRFFAFSQFIKTLMPLAIFTLIFLIKIKLTRTKLKKRKHENNMEITLYLTYFDKLKFDILIYSTPIIITGIAFTINKTITLTDIIQAIIVFLIMYIWQIILLKKE